MVLKTVLARIISVSDDTEYFKVLELAVFRQKNMRVYRGDQITDKDIEAMKFRNHFIELEETNALLPVIRKIIKADGRTPYRNIV